MIEHDRWNSSNKISDGAISQSLWILMRRSIWSEMLAEWEFHLSSGYGTCRIPKWIDGFIELSKTGKTRIVSNDGGRMNGGPKSDGGSTNKGPENILVGNIISGWSKILGGKNKAYCSGCIVIKERTSLHVLLTSMCWFWRQLVCGKVHLSYSDDGLGHVF
ncbi:uncharacterized protein LOC132276713 [Cornus florida]|uniref:uncharacterized protein LOC132276713 n=1 Tax=Cornus florida TaxID=4283 RepID=UPI0028A04DF2|nr:uncharacterized protein LOC132276713 [Cornus florida]